jgi:hypothetical protein
MKNIAIFDIEDQSNQSLIYRLTKEDLQFSSISIDCSSVAHQILGGSDDSVITYNLNNFFHPAELTKPPVTKPVLRG